MTARKFASIQLVNIASGGSQQADPNARDVRLLAIADDGTAWASGANIWVQGGGEVIMGVEAMTWQQIKPLPNKV